MLEFALITEYAFSMGMGLSRLSPRRSNLRCQDTIIYKLVFPNPYIINAL